MSVEGAVSNSKTRQSRVHRDGHVILRSLEKWMRALPVVGWNLWPGAIAGIGGMVVPLSK